MNEPILNKHDTLNALPPEFESAILPKIRDKLQATGKKLVILDDDPTGTQTIHGLPVLTEWSIERLTIELEQAGAGFYILTNSRSLTADEAYMLNYEIGMNLKMASKHVGCEYALVSRSDSTLRGHFPLELDALSETLEKPADVWLLIQFFLEGGRYTINDVHYVAEEDSLIPAGQTPFAQDKAFGYKASHLKEWIEEKSDGRIKAESVQSISIDDIRTGGPDAVAQKLLSMPSGSVCVVNSASYRDQEVFVDGLLQAEAQGKTFMYRTAASFVRPRVGLAGRPLLTADEMLPDASIAKNGGLTIVGSYVPKTTAQLNALLSAEAASAIELDVEALLDDKTRVELLEETACLINDNIAHGCDVVVFTSRKLIAADDKAISLKIGNIVSDCLVRLVRCLRIQPRYLIAKGGITSSDIATKSLGIKRAIVQGQILPGIPVWKLGPESKFPDMSYVIFPGNVGNDESLLNAVQTFQKG